MSVSPSLTDTAPNGSEEIDTADLQSLSLSIMNQAGQVVETDAYYNLPDFSGDITSGVVGTDNILNAFAESDDVWSHVGTLWTPGTASADADYYTTTYQYDADGNLDREMSPDGNITRWVYDSLGREESVWVGGNGWTDAPDDKPESDYWSPSNSASMVETTSYQYDDGDPDGQAGDSNLTQIISFESQDGSLTITPEVTDCYYDWQDELVATKQGVLLDDYHQAAGDEQTYVEDSYDETVDPTAQLPITYYTLDNLGEVTQVAVYNGDGISVTYSDAGVPEAPGMGLTSETAYVYDAQGRTDETTQYSYISDDTASGGESTYVEFDGDANAVSSTDPMSNVTSYVYDGAGRDIEMIAPNPNTGEESGGLTTHYGYDNDGDLTSVTDPMGNVTTYCFDYAGRETAEYEPNPSTGDAGGPETSYTFDTAGNVATMTDPDGNAITYSHDALGREIGTSEEVAETSSTNVTATTSDVYDGDNNVLEAIDADGRADVYTYDDLDQQTEEQWYATTCLDTATNTIATTYDLSGDTLSSVDTYPDAEDTQDSSCTFAYNTLGQQITSDNNGSGAEGTTGTAGVPDVVLNSTFDANGDRVSLAATIASTADFQNAYTYDGLGNEQSVLQEGVDGGNTVAAKGATFFYDDDNQLYNMLGYGGSSADYVPIDNLSIDLATFYDYDHDGNVTDFTDYGYDYTGATGYQFTGGYGYDGFIEMESLTFTRDADQRLTYVTNNLVEAYFGIDATWANQGNSYNHDSELTSVSAGYGGASYDYTANGNLDAYGDTTGDGNAELSSNGYAYTYDAAGNILTQTDGSGNVTTYVWDNRNRLASATLKNSDGVTQWVVDYTYDSMNQLIGRTLTPYDDGVAGTPTTQRFVYDPSTGQMQLAFDGSGNLTDRYLWGPVVDEILADEKGISPGYGGTLEWIATEHNVSDVWIAGSDAVLDNIQFNAFGGLATATSPSNNPIFGFDGAYTDPTTGLQYHNEPFSGEPGRWYNPNCQTWMSQDPIFPLSGSNPYEAFNNSPTNFTDPSGLQSPGGDAAGGWFGHQFDITLNPPQQAPIKLPDPLDPSLPPIAPPDEQDLGNMLADEIAAAKKARTIDFAGAHIVLSPTVAPLLHSLEEDIGKFGLTEFNSESQAEKDTACLGAARRFGRCAPNPSAGNGQFNVMPIISFNESSGTLEGGVTASSRLGGDAAGMLGAAEQEFKNHREGWTVSGSLTVTSPDWPVGLSLDASAAETSKGDTAYQGVLSLKFQPGQSEPRRP